MKVKIRNSKQKGVALAFALMTALLLMTLSTTVVGLSLRHARAGADADYVQEALHAADWYVNATLDYMNSKEAYTTSQKYSYSNPYVDTKNLASAKNCEKKALGRDDVFAVVTEISDDNTARSYGMDPDILGGNKAHVVKFTSADGSPLVTFPSSGTDITGSFAVCEVAVEKIPPKNGKYSTSSTPGYYHLSVFSRVYDISMQTKIAALQKDSKIGIDQYPSEGLLATRVIDVKARTEGPMDYLHIIQDGRSWRAQGLNLDGRNGLFEQYQDGNDYALDNGLLNCGFPQGYRENGRLRIDGGTRMANARGGVVIDGSAQFFNTSATNYASFAGELTQQRAMSTISYSKNNNGAKGLAGVCGGGLNDGAKSIGLPQSGQNSNYDTSNPNYDKSRNYVYQMYKDRDTYQSFARETASDAKASGTSINLSIGGAIGTSKVKVGTVNKNETTVPDVYSPINSYADGKDVDIRPGFAKIVVELGDGDQVRIYKTNPAYNKARGSDLNEVIYSGKASGIKNGVIAVQGGNVEVCSKTDSKGQIGSNGKGGFTGDLTIVSDVNADREDSLAYFNDSKGKSYKSGNSIYSDVAREYYEKHPTELPPYKVSTLMAAGYKSTDEKCIKDANKNAYVWPTPTSEAVEREGNVFITSDVQCKSVNGKRGSLGIVAKNYVSLNDKTALKKGSSADKQILNVEAMLFSFDKSVQFDWSNDAGNDTATFNALKSGGENRKFNLTGSVVSTNLDIEASTETRNGKSVTVGYLIQNEKSNVSLDNPPPFTPAYSEGTGRWVIISYVDRGSRNWF